MSTLRLAGQTDVGRRRRDNQDTFISAPLWAETTALLVVIDGVGGYAGGDRAAAIAKASIEQYMAAPTGDTLTMLREAVVYANNQIAEERRQEPRLAQMCCVLTAAVADAQAGTLVYAHVGDTRLYRFQAGALDKLTRDHSLVGIREDANQLTEAEAMNHPRRNEILREVGSAVRRIDDPDFLDSGETDFRPGDVLLLCSDGLTDMLTRAQLTAVLTEPLSEEEQVAELIRQANEQGGYDNITVVLARNNTPAEAVIANGPPAEPNELPDPSLSASPVSAVAPAESRVAADKPARTGRLLIGTGVLVVTGLLAALVWQLLRQPGESAEPARRHNPPALMQPLTADSTATADTAARRDTGRAAPVNQTNQSDSSRRP